MSEWGSVYNVLSDLWSSVWGFFDFVYSEFNLWSVLIALFIIGLSVRFLVFPIVSTGFSAGFQGLRGSYAEISKSHSSSEGVDDE